MSFSWEGKSGVAFRHPRRPPRGRRASTLRGYRNIVTSSLLPSFGGKLLADITAAEVDAYRVSMIGDNSAATINRKLQALNAIFKWAIRYRGLKFNPCSKVERQSVRASGAYTAYEPAEVLALANNSPEPYASLFIFAAFSGLRIGELRALKWSNVDRQSKLIYVEAGYVAGVEGLPKSGKVRSVPLVDQATAALDRLTQGEPDDLVFRLDNGSRLDDSKIRKVMAKAAKAAGLPVYRFHDLRHTFGTLMARVLPIHDVQRIMGHADIQTTMLYLHSKPMDEQTDRLNDLINGALKPKLSVAA